MFRLRVTTRMSGGIIYTDGGGMMTDGTPLLCIHGVGGHHRNFALLHAQLREAVPKAIPFFVDVPGFGYVRNEPLSLHRIEKFLGEACTAIADACGRPVLLFHESAAVWFTLRLCGHAPVCTHTVITYNPVRIYRPSAETLRSLLGSNVLDVRSEFLRRFFPPERIARMDADELGRPSVPLAFLAQLWKVQKQQPLAGWDRAVLIETRVDPMREFRVALTNRTVELHELDSHHHGLGEDLVARRVALIVRSVIDRF